MEQQLQTGRLSLAEEKKVVADISALNKAKKSFDTFSSQQNSVESDKLALDEARSKLKVLDTKRDALRSEGMYSHESKCQSFFLWFVQANKVL